MSLISWPATLPLPLLSGHGYTPGKTIIETELDSGYSRTRRRFKNAPATMPAVLILRGAQAGLFEAWIFHYLEAGAEWFLMPVKTTQGTSDLEVRINGQPKYDFQAPQVVKATFSMTIRRSDLLTKEQTDLLLTYEFNDLIAASIIANGMQL